MRSPDDQESMICQYDEALVSEVAVDGNNPAIGEPHGEVYRHAIFEQAAVGMAVAALDGRFREVNDKFCSILGYTREELRDMTFAQLTFPDDLPETQRLVRRLLNAEVDDYTVEKRYVRKDGDVMWSRTTVTLLKDAVGTPVQFLGVIEDITQLKQDDLEIARLWNVLEKSLNEIYVFDTNTLHFTYVNQGALRNLGYSMDDLRAMTPLDIKPEFTEQQFRRMVEPLLQEYQEKIVFNTLHRRSDGSNYPVEAHLQVVDHAGTRVFLVVALDITERQRAEAALRRSEAELRTLADSISQLAWMAEPDGNIFWYNQRWYEYTGTTLEQMQGWGWRQVHDPAVLPHVMERWQHSLKTGEAFEMEFPLRGADGIFRWFLTRIQPVRDGDGNVLRWFGTNTDVDQVKRIREALQDETRILELLNHTGTILSSNLDLQTLVQSVTDAATQLSGAQFGAFFYNVINDAGESFLLYTLSGAPREAFEKFGLPRNTPVFDPTFRGQGVVRSGDIMRDPRYGRLGPHHGMPAGHLSVRSYLAVPVMARSGEVIGGLFFGHPDRDVFTERHERIVVGLAAQAAIAIDNARLYEAAQKAAEERRHLLENERAARADAERASAMKDAFLANLSHELRTPLNAILGWTQVLQMRANDDDDTRRGLETIERNARVQAQLIEDLLDMSRITSGKVRLHLEPLDMRSIIEAALETVRPAASAKQISLITDYAQDVGTLYGDANRLQQVIWNLLSNAIKFTPEAGTVQVKLSQGAHDLEISVRDSGIGIDPQQLGDIFERFHQIDASTTRKFGGLGIGLSIVKHLVELHGGSVEASSEGRDRGTTFNVRLPLTAAPIESDDMPPPVRDLSDHPPAHRASDLLAGMQIIVVDDEADARLLIARVLSDCGAEVVTADSATTALRLLETLEPRLLISDIGMPEIDGYEFLQRVRASDGPGGSLPAIALTAFAGSQDRTRALQAGYQLHLTKPVEPADLVAAIVRLIDQG